MRLTLTLALLLFGVTTTASAAEPCQQINGRAHYYFGDGQFRLWHIGTHHEFLLLYSDNSDGGHYAADEKIYCLLQTDIKRPAEISTNDLFGDFLVCPVERFEKGAVQSAYVKTIYHSHLVHTPWVEPTYK